MLYIAAASSGLLIAACFLRFSLYPLAWVAFSPLLWALHRAGSRRDAVRLGLVAGMATNIPAFYWLVYTFHVFGGFPYSLSTFLYSCLSLLSSGQFVLFALLLWRRGPGPLQLTAPVAWVALEFLYPNLFPWRMAHTQWHLPALLQVGELTGPYSLSFAIVWFAAAIATRSRRDWTALLASATLGIAIALYGWIRIPQIDATLAIAPTTRVALVQGNIGIEEKGNISYFEINLEQYRQLSLAHQEGVDLLVWPETVQQRWVDVEASQLADKVNPFPDLRTNLVFGGLAFRLLSLDPQEAEEFNSAFLIGPNGQVRDRYDKRILMPFGEYIPLASYLPWIQDLSPESGSFTAGQQVRVFDLEGKGKVGQLICYEDIVTSMPRSTTLAGAELLVTILNDAWYGNTAAPYQHQALALWRTVENRRFLLRGSNSGVTSVIDAAGRIVAEGPLFESIVLRAEVPRLTQTTFYTRYGDIFAWLVVIGAALLTLSRPQSSAR